MNFSQISQKVFETLSIKPYGTNPDGLEYEFVQNKVFVMNKRESSYTFSEKTHFNAKKIIEELRKKFKL